LIYWITITKTRTNIYDSVTSGKGCRLCGNAKISEIQLRNFAEGRVDVRLGKNPSWKGGVTDLNKFLRERENAWRKQYFEKYNYKCVISGESGDRMQVHHSIPFHELRDEVLQTLNLTLKAKINEYQPSELNAIAEMYSEKLKNVEGLPMARVIHRLFHKLYGFKTNEMQVVEFRERYQKGEFLEYLNKDKHKFDNLG
jgi:hypothetical protein